MDGLVAVFDGVIDLPKRHIFQPIKPTELMVGMRIFCDGVVFDRERC